MSDNVYTYINGSVEPYLRDPPDTEFQRGYLAALLNVAEEALGLHLAKRPSRKRRCCVRQQARCTGYSVKSRSAGENWKT